MLKRIHPLILLVATACGSGAGSSDELRTSEACETEPALCKPIRVVWTLWEDADFGFDEISCTDAGAETVELELTPAGLPPRFATFDCTAGEGLTPPLEAGGYTTRVRLFSAGTLIGESEAETETVGDGEGATALFDFECAAGSCENRGF